MSRLLGVLAAVGFIAAVIVHGRTFIPDTSISAAALLLHLGAFVVFIPAIIALRGVLGPQPTMPDFRSILPSWAIPLLIAAFAYAMVNFCVDLMLLPGTPDIRDGHYVLLDHGKLIRNLTREEYLTIDRYQMRLFSGHWMFFYLFPAIYFLFGPGFAGSGVARPPVAPSAHSPSSPD